MGHQLYNASPAAREVFDRIDHALDRPLTQIMFEGPEDLLRQTINAQPAIMAVSLASLKALEENFNAGHSPAFLAGHSVGEYTALVAADALNTEDTALLVQERGRLMQIACDQRPGTMAAILGMDESILLKIAAETGTYISNVNSTGQIVISGDHSGVYKAMEMAMMQGAKKTVPLRVGGAFHSGLMEPALQGLEEVIDKLRFNEPRIPIVANCTAEPLHTVNDLKKELIAQITGCVQWSRSIEYMSRAGVDLFIEVGTGKALTGMVKRIIKGVRVASMGDLDSIRSFELS